MAWRALFLTGITVLLFGCADVLPLTGGPEDEKAPSVVRQEPEQGMVNYTGNRIEVEFDEYVKLNDPNSTVTINPATVKIKTELNRKTLYLKWDGILDRNTTYIIQLNGTVRDINEANDSIMQLVFSTGPVIDSLTIKGSVSGAFSNNALSQITIGLYAPDSNFLSSRPVYATRSDAKGAFTFSYLKPGKYRVFAFGDTNKDQRPQADESVGFADSLISAGDTTSVAIRVFRREAKKNTLRADLVPPGAAVVYNVDSMDISRLTVNGTVPRLLERYSDDSLLIALPESTGTNLTFSYDSTRINRAITASDRSARLAVRQVGSTNWKSGDSLKFTVPDGISAIDTAKIALQTTKGKMVGYGFSVSGNQLFVVPDAKNTDGFGLFFEKGAITGRGSVNDTARFSYTTLLKSDLSNLKINCKGFSGQWIFELTQNDKVLYSQVKGVADTVVAFNGIVPGVYNLRCISDENLNGRWDSGNIDRKIQPEILKRFTLTQKLRPNWDVEETVIFEE